MEISLEKPPIWDEASKLFGVKETDPIFFTYGNTIYAPCKKMPPDYLIVHEEIHAEQQGHNEADAAAWWDRYLADAEFRIAQEAEAYGAQYKFQCAKEHDRNQRARMLHEIAAHFSGTMYGKCVGYHEAAKLVRDYADGKALKNIEKHMPDIDDPET